MDSSPCFEPKGWYSRGYLPHFDSPGLTQFLTFRLEDACPRVLHDRWLSELATMTPEKRKQEYSIRLMEQLDRGAGSCILRMAKFASLVENSLLHFDGDRYRLLSWVVMPNHVHCLIEVHDCQHIHSIVHSWKSFTANQINKLLNREGRLWHREYYDRYIRDIEHYRRVASYIEANPVKAHLCNKPSDWRWSSAYRNRTEVS